MRAAAWLLIVIAVLLVPACRRGAAPAVAPVALPAGPSWSAAPTQRVYYDNAGGIQDSVRLVIRDAQQLSSVWRQATSRQEAPPPMPEVNFEREMLLVVAAGRRSAEDQIRIDSVGIHRDPAATGRSAPQSMTAIVRLTEGCRRFATDAYPIEIVRVQRFNGPVNWVDRRVQALDCPRAAVDVPGFSSLRGQIARQSAEVRRPRNRR